MSEIERLILIGVSGWLIGWAMMAGFLSFRSWRRKKKEEFYSKFEVPFP